MPVDTFSLSQSESRQLPIIYDVIKMAESVLTGGWLLFQKNTMRGFWYIMIATLGRNAQKHTLKIQLIE